MTRVLTWTLVFILCMGSGAGSIWAAEPPTPPSCAILSGSGNRAPDPAVRAMLEARLFAEPGLRFVEREEVARVVQEHNLASAEWSASASRVKLGAIIPADVLLFLQGISVGPNPQTRIDVTESRSGVMLGSWIEQNAAVRSAPDAIVARIRTAAEKSRIPPEARHLIGLLDFRGEESGLQMESAATTLSDLTIPALSRIPNVLILDREHIEHLQTERDLTAMEAKLRPSVMLLEGGLRGGAMTNEYAVTVQLRRLGGGGATNRVVVAPRANLVVTRDGVIDAVSTMLGTAPAATTDVSRAEEAAAFARQIPLWESWGDHERAVRSAEAAYAIDPSQANRIALASILFDGGRARLEHLLRAKLVEADYNRVQMDLIAAGATLELDLAVLPIEGERLEGAAQLQQPELVRRISRLHEESFRVRVQHYAAHFADCENQYWDTWAAGIQQEQLRAMAPGDPARQAAMYWEAVDAFASPPEKPARFPVCRLGMLRLDQFNQSSRMPTKDDAVNLEVTEKMIRHPHPFIRLLGHSFRERELRKLLPLQLALDSRHAIFQILAEEVPATHPYRQHFQPKRPWLVVDLWISWLLPNDALSDWQVSLPAGAIQRDADDKARYFDSLLASCELARFYMMGEGPHVTENHPRPLMAWLNEIAGAGRPAEALRLTSAIRTLAKDHPVPEVWWRGWRSWTLTGDTFWTVDLADAESRYRQMVDPLAPQQTPVAAAPRPLPKERVNSEPKPDPIWDEYEFIRHPLQIPVQDNPVVAVDGNRVCMVCPCNEPGHLSGPGVHAYLFWASSGAPLAERHVAVPPWPPLPLYARDSIHSAALAGDTVYVGTSLGLLCIPFGRGESRLLTRQDGLPGNLVRAVGWYGGRVYFGLGTHPESEMREMLARGTHPLYAGSSDEHTQASVLACWDPASNRLEILASEKAVAKGSPMDGAIFNLDVIMGDPARKCIWLGDRGLSLPGPKGLDHRNDWVWRLDPRTRELARVDPGPIGRKPCLILPGARHVGWPWSYVFVPQLESVVGAVKSGHRHSLAFDGTNVVAVGVTMTAPTVSSMSRFASSKTSVLRRGREPVSMAVFSNGAAFPMLYSVHETGSGVIAVSSEGSIMLIRRNDGKAAYLESETQASNGSVDEALLLRAAAAGRVSELSQLLDKGVRVDATDLEGKTALMYAIREVQHEAADLLLRRGAGASCRTRGDVSVLCYAAQAGDVTMAGRLLAMGADLSQASRARMTPLLYAAMAGHVPAVRFLVEHGAGRDAANASGLNALHYAVELRNVELAEYLLGKGMDPNTTDGRGEPPLLAAVESHQSDMARLLLSRGASPEVEGRGNAKPLSVAVEQGDSEMVSILLKGAAKTEVVNADGRSPLRRAAYASQTNIVKLLLAAGAQADWPNAWGWTALAVAAQKDSVVIVDALLGAGASVEARNNEGWTPLMIAAKEGQLAVVRLLIEHKAHVNAQDKEGNTPLHIARASLRSDILRLLLANGADPKIKNKKGEPAMVQEK